MLYPVNNAAGARTVCWRRRWSMFLRAGLTSGSLRGFPFPNRSKIGRPARESARAEEH